MKKNRAFIIHGWGATPESNWFPWLQGELNLDEIETVVPEMPDTENPILSKWLEKMREVIGEVDENTYLIGHSLGAITILRYIENLKDTDKVGGVILVSGFEKSLGIMETENFLQNELNYAKIKKIAKEIVMINSDDDMFVPLELGKSLSKNLGAELIVLPNAGHINDVNGTFMLPEALEVILKMAKK